MKLNLNEVINMSKVNQINKERVILAYGEVTGHCHAFNDGDAAVLENNQLTIKKDNAELTHEEHGTHSFNIGTGEVIIQREYRMGSLKRVLD